MKAPGVYIFLLLTIEVLMISSFNRQGRSLLYPKAGICKLIIGMAIPVDLPKNILSWGVNFQFQYKLPPNATELHELPEVGRSLSRSMNRAALYRALETVMDRQGLDGRACLLRSICEVAETPVHFHNGLFGDLLHVVLSPGPNSMEKVDDEYHEAQQLGMEGINCRQVFAECLPGTTGILDMVSFIYHDYL